MKFGIVIINSDKSAARGALCAAGSVLPAGIVAASRGAAAAAAEYALERGCGLALLKKRDETVAIYKDFDAPVGFDRFLVRENVSLGKFLRIRERLFEYPLHVRLKHARILEALLKRAGCDGVLTAVEYSAGSDGAPPPGGGVLLLPRFRGKGEDRARRAEEFVKSTVDEWLPCVLKL